MKKLIWVICCVAILTPSVRSQDDAIARKLFEEAVEVMGGSAFSDVSDIVSSGNYYVFDRYGASSPLIRFTDYTKLPDKSRYELGNKKKQLDITVFNLEKNEGWFQEGQKPTKAATSEDMREFRNAVKHSLEMIFRTRYKDPNNSLFYLGPGDGRDVTLERVKLIDPENDEVTVYFDRLSKLPAKIEFKSMNREGVRQRVVYEYSQWHWIQGVRSSLRTDGYVNGRRSFQSFVIDIKYNNNLEESVFSEPVPPK